MTMPHNNAICMLCLFKLRVSPSKVVCIAKPDGTKLTAEEIPEKSVDIIERGIKGECPIGKITRPDAKVELTEEQKEQQKQIEAERIRKFHETWERFHRLSIDNRLTDAIIIDMMAAIGCGGCSDHFKRWLVVHLLPKENQFEWGVDGHDWVNGELGKSKFGLEAAKKKYLA